MELHQLRYALAVVDAGSFTAAADAVHVSQSGISAQVQKLERELGVALFDRSTRRVTLTPEGERLIPTFRAALNAVGEVRTAADDLRGLVTGSLRVGTVTGLGWSRFFDALAQLHQDHPGIDIRVNEGTSDDILAAVRRGESDLAIAAWTGEQPEGLQSTIVFDDALVAVVAPEHPWASRRSIRVAELVDADLITLPAGTGVRAALDAILPASAPRWEVSTPSFVEMLAVRGLGVGIVSETTASEWKGVRAVPIDAPAARSRLGVAWRTGPTHATRALLGRLLPENQSPQLD
ncbi:LysR family transcriptional regulator [Microbacterium sp. A93]|uniref:LysR family transcriptional regulator n=1 Tax=unclassified Microbacterium TaxID=2609290 RepID=UPI003F41F28E